MRKKIKGKRLSRNLGHRKALYRNLVQSLFRHGTIKTTLAKATVVRPIAERLITKLIKGKSSAEKQVEGFFYDSKVFKKLKEEIAPRYLKRPGGYTKILKLGRRQGDNAPMAILKLVEE